MTDKLDLDKYEWNEFFLEFQKETPRAAVIVSAALLDTLLRDLIAAFMIDESKAVDDLLGTDNNSDAPLSAFGARIRTAYCLGLISKSQYQDLLLIKKIRNKFAHRLQGYSFEKAEVVGWCNLFQIPKRHEKILSCKSCRDKYTLTVSMLVSDLSLRIRVPVKRCNVADDPELNRGFRVET